MDRREIVLAGLAAAGGGTSFAPVQVQKLFFLIDREIPQFVEGPHFNFRPYDYGPFDSAVYDTLDFLAFGGLVEIESSGRYRRYSLTSDGFRSGQEVLSLLAPEVRKFVADAAAWILSLRFDQLVSAIYRRYPDMKVNSIFKQ